MSAENKSSGQSAAFDKCSFVLVDVLGTTTSINFAKETLFPYVVKNVEEVLTAKWDDEAVKSAVKQLKEDDEEISLEAAVKLVKELTESTSENAGLKAIQGIVYEKGYESGDLKAHVFSDVPTSFASWAKSRKIAVYSTGSVDSQKQLFSKSVEGDLSQYISNYFDQSVGPKSEADSYKNIVEKLAVKPEEILFITDLIEEAKAAKSAGLSTAIVTREGNSKLPEDSKEFTVISSFKDITFENPSKRKITEELAVTEEPPSKQAKTESEKDVKSEDKPEKTKLTEVATENTENKETVEDEAMEVDAPETLITKEPSGEPQETAKPEANEKTESIPQKTETPVVDIAITDSEKNTKVEETKTEKTEEKKDLCDKVEVNAKKEDKTEIDSDSKSPVMEITKTESGEVVKKEAKLEATKPATGELTVVSIAKDGKKADKMETTDIDSKKDELVEKSKSISTKTDSTEEPVTETDKTQENTASKSEESTEKKEVESKEAKSAESVVESTSKVDESVEVLKSEDKTSVETSKQVAEESPKVEAEVASTEAKTNEEAKAATEESPETKSEEEKENQKDLANKLENGDSIECKIATNGEASEEAKTNGDSEQSNDQGSTNGQVESPIESEKVEEIKVKKVDASPTSTDTPAVSVEV